MNSAKRCIISGGLFGALGIIAGAFGAHALRDRLSPDMLEVFQTAARYQMYHALALLLIGLLMLQIPASARCFRWAGRAFSFGILIFSGSLYALALGAPRSTGAITPFGGALFIAGWICIAWSSWKGLKQQDDKS